MFLIFRKINVIKKGLENNRRIPKNGKETKMKKPLVILTGPTAAGKTKLKIVWKKYERTGVLPRKSWQPPWRYPGRPSAPWKTDGIIRRFFWPLKLSVALAKAVDGEIISADSMQVYRHMDIGSAKIQKE